MLRYRLIGFGLHVVRTLLLTRIKTSGQEHLPEHGPYIVVVNHNSAVDSPILMLAFPVQRWRFFAGEKWQHHPVFGPIMGWLGAIFINRSEIDRRGLREAIAALADDCVFGLAPEGHRSKVGAMQAGKDGAAYLASKVPVPIVPVGLVNTDVLFANFKQLRITTVEVRIGESFYLPKMGKRVRSRDLSGYTTYIMIHIAALLPEKYHGYYADHPGLAALQRGEDPWPYIHSVPDYQTNRAE